MTPIRVLLADDQPVFLEGLRAYAERAGDLSVVSTAGTGTEAIARTLDTRPDVVVLDLRLPRADGLTVTRRITADAPEVTVLVVTAQHGEEHISAAMSAGAAGYVTKHAEPQDILTAIRVVARGGLFVNAAIAPQIRRFLGVSRRVEIFPQLTLREREILDQMMRDTPTFTIARKLGITGKTVRNHVSNILAKLSVSTRAEAVRMAREAGIREHPAPERRLTAVPDIPG